MPGNITSSVDSEENKKPNIALALMYDSKKTLRFKRKIASIGTIDFIQFIQEESIEKDTYEINFKCTTHIKFGLDLIIRSDGVVIVRQCQLNSDNKPSNIENYNKVASGDQLLRVNDIHLNSLSFIQVTELIQSVKAFDNVCFQSYHV